MKTIVKNSVYCGMMFLLSFSLHALEMSQETEIVVPEDITQQINDTKNKIDDQQTLDQSLEISIEEAMQAPQEITEESNQDQDYPEFLNQDKKSIEGQASSLDDIIYTQQNLEPAQSQEVKQINNDLAVTQQELTPEIQNLDYLDILEQEVLEQPELEDKVQEVLEKIEDIELQ